MELLKENIESGPILEIPDPSQRFYIKDVWYKDGVGEVILQLEYLVEAIKAEAQEKDGDKQEFDKSLEIMCL